MTAPDNARLEAMARAAADALTGATVDWEGFPPATRRVFLDVAMAGHLADRIMGEKGAARRLS
ncbi:MAG: hypothetical protein ACR2FH_07640 [Caulobacteraceae bacterium]